MSPYCIADGGMADGWGGHFFGIIPPPRDNASAGRGLNWLDRLRKMSEPSRLRHAHRLVPALPDLPGWPGPPRLR